VKRSAIIAVLIVFFLTTAMFRFLISGDDVHVMTLFLFAFKVTAVLVLIGAVLGWIGLQTRGREKSIRIIQNYSIVLVTCLLLSVITEVGLRLVLQDVTTTADNNSYFAHRWNKQVKYNRTGFRGQEYKNDKPAGIYRIAVVGDSLTFGQGIDINARFSDRIERVLNNESGKQRYQVLNFGKPGDETEDELSILVKYVIPAHPDFVLLQWYVNDPQGQNKSTQPRPRRVFPEYLVRNSALLYLLEKQFSELQVKFGWIGSHHDYMVKRFKDPNSPDSQEARKELRAFVDQCRKHDIGVGMVVFSDSYFSDNPLDFLVDQVVTFCNDEKITCVDMRGPLAPYHKSIKLWANRLDHHPSALANKLAAAAILEAFKVQWLTKS